MHHKKHDAATAASRQSDLNVGVASAFSDKRMRADSNNQGVSLLTLVLVGATCLLLGFVGARHYLLNYPSSEQLAIATAEQDQLYSLQARVAELTCNIDVQRQALDVSNSAVANREQVLASATDSLERHVKDVVRERQTPQ